MSRHYFESRPHPNAHATSFAPDIMRHLHSRQYLGKALVVCDTPLSTMRVCRKQWLKLCRVIQRQRASTLNADKILRFTYTITHMQHMQFTAKAPIYRPDSHVYFIGPDLLQSLPLNCYSVYLTIPLANDYVGPALLQLPEGSLVVDYTTTLRPSALGLHSKMELEQECTEQWKVVEHFLSSQGITIASLRPTGGHVDAMDIALDTLLGVSHSFLAVATSFQRALEIAQPLSVDRATQQLYNLLTLLAYRVQALTPSMMSTHMLRTYHEDETFFLHDVAANLVPETETLLETVERHRRMGRYRLAAALIMAREQRSLYRPPSMAMANFEIASLLN